MRGEWEERRMTDRVNTPCRKDALLVLHTLSSYCFHGHTNKISQSVTHTRIHKLTHTCILASKQRDTHIQKGGFVRDKC